MVVADHSLLAHLDGAALNAADADTAHVVAVVDGGDQQLEGALLVSLGSGDVVHDGLKEGGQILAHVVGIKGSGAVAARAVEHRRIQLLVGGVQVDEQLQDLVLHLTQAGVGLVDLVDADDDAVVEGQGLLKHEAGLGHGALGGVHQQDNAVDHLQHALHLTAEVGVAGGVDDVDLLVLVVDGGVLGQNGNAALLFQIPRVHDAGGGVLVVAVDAALLEKTVHQGGLTVVNVGDDGYVTEVVTNHLLILLSVGFPHPVRENRKTAQYFIFRTYYSISRGILKRLKKTIFNKCWGVFLWMLTKLRWGKKNLRVGVRFGHRKAV